MKRRLARRLEPSLAFNQPTSFLSRCHRRAKLIISIVALTAPILCPVRLISVTKREDKVNRLADERQQHGEQLNRQSQHISHRTSFRQVWVERQQVEVVCEPDRIHRRRGSLREGVLPDEEVVPEARHRERHDANLACRDKGDHGIVRYPDNIGQFGANVKPRPPVAPLPAPAHNRSRPNRHAPDRVLPPLAESMYIAWRRRSPVLTGKPRQAGRTSGRRPSRGSSVSSNDRCAGRRVSSPGWWRQPTPFQIAGRVQRATPPNE